MSCHAEPLPWAKSDTGAPPKGLLTAALFQKLFKRPGENASQQYRRFKMQGILRCAQDDSMKTGKFVISEGLRAPGNLLLAGAAGCQVFQKYLDLKPVSR